MKFLTQRRGRARLALRLPLFTATVAASACGDLTTPDFNRPALDDLRERPNATLVNAATVGMLASSRLDADVYIRFTGILGREIQYLDSNEPRYLSELAAGSLNSSSFAGGGLWTNRYGTVLQGVTLLKALDKVPTVALSDAQKEGIRGYTKTVMAHDLVQIGNTRAEAPVEINDDPLAAPAPLVPRAQVYARAAQLLDEGVVHLRAPGTSFSFVSPPQFTQFTNGTPGPADVARVNRALRARVAVLSGDYARAYALLNNGDSTFISMPALTPADSVAARATMNLGSYYSFGTGSGDRTNGLATPTPQVADTSLRRDAQLRPTGSRDFRFTDKTQSFAGRSLQGISSNLRIAVYNQRPFVGSTGTSSPIPIIRNEELILLRAEAEWRTGRLADAINTLNYVRTNSGRLAARTDITAANFLDALLYERRYSLMFEGWRWVDLRRFDLLDTVRDYPRQGDRAPAAFPIPFNECIARGNGAEAC